ncbi:MAG: branched-chain amino acid ABC transporter permease [Candidatus Hecatellales archaeon]|nr:MAG: branched-chain amino acid ABC transporter permease [Candidatus Hecatellales archaeon]
MLTAEQLFIIDLLATLAPYTIVTLSLNLEYGYGGIPNFGKTIAVAGGAFLVGALPGRLLALMLGLNASAYISNNAKIVTQINGVLQTNILLSIAILVLSLVLAMGVGAGLGYLAACPAIRLRAEYLAMTFLAFGEVILVIGYNYPELVGGTIGVSVPDVFAWAGEMRFPAITFFMLFMAVLVFLYVERLTNSPLGRLLRAIRDNEEAALALGKDITKIRMRTIMLASAIAALGGALYAFYAGSVIATAYHRVGWTFWPWVMVILGGAANNFGVILGTFAFVAVRKLIIYNKAALAPYIPFDVVWLDMLILGLALLIILLYKPEGLIPEKPTRTLDAGRLQRLRERLEKVGVEEA